MAKPAARRTNWQKLRKLFNDIHLWLGLSSGLIVIAVCFSGTVYVFNTELTERAAPHLYRVTPVAGKERIPADSLIEKVKAASGGSVVSVTIPDDLKRTYQFNVKKKGDDSRGGVGYFVNPYTGEIAGNSKEKNGTKEFMGTMFSLHRWLLLDRVEKPIIKGTPNRELGSMITGWATIIFTLGCITGLIIWFPQKLKAWKQGLKIKWGAGWKRVNHDLHNTLAFYALFFLLLMGLTGPQWSFEWYRNGLQKTLGTYKPKDGPKEKSPKSILSSDSLSKTNLSIADYIKEADKVFAYSGNYMITFPAGAAATAVVSKTKTGFFAPAAADRLTIDPYSGKVLKKEIFKDKPFNERIAGSIKAIHVGNVYGTFTKLIYFLACLIATSLPITGTMIWLNKMKKKNKRKASDQPAINIEEAEQVA
ncbi:PepSY-associated TM helix domain-containing protein [Terrimonas pollutisoli]|uniref:PepSY-associated TM helix domain-containing protein n=1 Tax=Terrimonas pollutisoli TaxID=3034147 RepID=UPI0023EBCAE9|nr:PepSY-associated TM helix domain-containing protein [Terrimonas sp. H1YJ31]